MTRKDAILSLGSSATMAQSPDAVTFSLEITSRMSVELIQTRGPKAELTIRLHPTALAQYAEPGNPFRTCPLPFPSLPLASMGGMCYTSNFTPGEGEFP